MQGGSTIEPNSYSIDESQREETILKKPWFTKFIFALALPATVFAYAAIAAAFALPAVATYSAATYGESSAKTGRILKSAQPTPYPEKPTVASETFKTAHELAKHSEARR